MTPGGLLGEPGGAQLAAERGDGDVIGNRQLIRHGQPPPGAKGPMNLAQPRPARRRRCGPELRAPVTLTPGGEQQWMCALVTAASRPE